MAYALKWGIEIWMMGGAGCFSFFLGQFCDVVEVGVINEKI
jgi:hypothetical protein